MATSNPSRSQEESTTEKAKDAAGDATEKAKEAAEGAADRASKAAGDAKDKVEAKTSEFADQAKDKARQQADKQKARASKRISGIARAIRKTGDTLREEDQDLAAGYVDRAAEQVEHASDYLSDRSFGELTRDIESYARRQPVLFMGGAFALGLAGARFLKSSAPERAGGEAHRGMPRPENAGRQQNAGSASASATRRATPSKKTMTKSKSPGAATPDATTPSKQSGSSSGDSASAKDRSSDKNKMEGQ